MLTGLRCESFSLQWCLSHSRQHCSSSGLSFEEEHVRLCIRCLHCSAATAAAALSILHRVRMTDSAQCLDQRTHKLSADGYQIRRSSFL